MPLHRAGEVTIAAFCAVLECRMVVDVGRYNNRAPLLIGGALLLIGLIGAEKQCSSRTSGIGPEEKGS